MSIVATYESYKVKGILKQSWRIITVADPFLIVDAIRCESKKLKLSIR